jgi:predicted nucleic acid-binding protein
VIAGGELLLDTGALVATLHREDRDHASCAAFLEGLRGTLLTTEAVLTESMHLMARVPGGAQACLDFFLRQGATLVPQSRQSLARCRQLVTRYHDLPMDFADATLVALAEDLGVKRIFTLDRRGFAVYRLHRRERFTIVPD